MFSLLSLESLSKIHSLLYSAFVGCRDRMESVCKNVIIVGVDFAHGHNGFVHFLLNDLIVCQLLS